MVYKSLKDVNCNYLRKRKPASTKSMVSKYSSKEWAFNWQSTMFHSTPSLIVDISQDLCVSTAKMHTVSHILKVQKEITLFFNSWQRSMINKIRSIISRQNHLHPSSSFKVWDKDVRRSVTNTCQFVYTLIHFFRLFRFRSFGNSVKKANALRE